MTWKPEPDKRPPDIASAALEKLGAEKEARIQAKIDAGKAVRSQHPVVVGVPDPKRQYAAVYRDAEGREVYPRKDYAVIITGVPRTGRDHVATPPWRPGPPQPIPEGPGARAVPAQYPTVTVGPWQYFKTTVRGPDPEKDDPGEIAEAWYRIEGNLLRVEDADDRLIGTVEINEGDDVVTAARKILREKHDRHGSFHDPIKYPKSSYH